MIPITDAEYFAAADAMSAARFHASALTADGREAEVDHAEVARLEAMFLDIQAHAHAEYWDAHPAEWNARCALPGGWTPPGGWVLRPLL